MERKSPLPDCGGWIASRSRRSSLPRRSKSPLVLLLLLAALSCRGPGEEPDEEPPPRLAVLDTRIWTGRPGAPFAEALLVEGSRIAAVGSSASIRERAGNARIVDGRGLFVVPGFIDSHVHFLEGGFRLSSVPLRDAATRDEFTARIAEYARTVPPGTWIVGGDWDHQLWGGELPHRSWIDPVTPQHPVWVNRLDGHMALANSRALAAASIGRETKEVEGGEIVRDPDGETTGVLKDNAMALVDRVVPPPTEEMSLRALDAAMSYIAERGVTSVHHMGSVADLEVFRKAHSLGKLRTRIYAAVPLEEWSRLRDLVAAEGRGDAFLRWGMVKGFVDGSLGSHTALFHAPYDDQPGNRGLFVTAEADLYRRISAADASFLHVAVHAIGDRANQTLLDIYQRVARENGPRDRRFRIEHAQHLRPEDIPRFAELEVIASMQPYHAIDDGRWAEKVIGPVRIRSTYAFRSLLDRNATLAFGSDWYVAPPDPLEGIHAAVTRRTIDGASVFVPEQRIEVEEALAAYTRAAARAQFSENEMGMLRQGFLADFVVLDRDLTAIAPEEIRDVRVLMTVVGGEVVHESSNH